MCRNTIRPLFMKRPSVMPGHTSLSGWVSRWGSGSATNSIGTITEFGWGHGIGVGPIAGSGGSRVPEEILGARGGLTRAVPASKYAISIGRRVACPVLRSPGAIADRSAPRAQRRIRSSPTPRRSARIFAVGQLKRQSRPARRPPAIFSADTIGEPRCATSVAAVRRADSLPCGRQLSLGPLLPPVRHSRLVRRHRRAALLRQTINRSGIDQYFPTNQAAP